MVLNLKKNLQNLWELLKNKGIIMRNKELTTKRISMELLEKGQNPLFAVNINNVNLGNCKYGSLKKSLHLNSSFDQEDKAKLFEVSCMETDEVFERYKNAMSFYVFHGAFDENEVAVIRNFKAIRKQGYFRVIDLLGRNTKIIYNPIMRLWTRLRFSELQPISELISDLITFKSIHSKI